MNNPTIISAALSDKELQDSINKMVANFDKGLQDMLDHSNKYVEKIQESLQKIGNTNFGAKGSNDGGVVKQTKAQNDFTDAVKKSTNEIKRQNQETAMSFDNIASATTKAARSASTFIQSERESLRMRQNEIQAKIDSLRKQFGNVEIKTIVRDDGTFSRAVDKEKQKIEEIRRQLQNVPPTSVLGKQFSQELQAARNEYNELIRSRKAFEAKSKIASLASEYEQNNKKLRELATSYRQLYTDEKQAETAMNNGAAAIARYGDSAEKAQQKLLKASFNRAINILPQGDDLAYAKLERLRAILADHRFLGALSPSEIKRARAEVQKLESQLVDYISKMNSSTQAQQQSANANSQQSRSIDEMNAYIAQNIRREQERREAIRQTGLAARETADQLIRSAHEQASAQGNSPITGIKELTVAVEQMRRAYFDMSASEKASPIGLALEADIKRANDAISVIRKYNQSLLGSQQNDANKITNASTLNSLRESLKNLTEQYSKLTVAELNAGKGDALIQHFQDTTRAAQILQRTLNRPVNLKAALSGDERTLDDIAYKMQRLRSYRQGIDLTKPNAANEIKQVDEALARLQKDADKWMSKSQDLIKNNTALGRSWNYMKNRLAFYFTVGASTQFVKSLIEVRSQYEMNERALGILINSAERGTQIFNELSQMALVSPYTLIELSSAAKQLTAYDIAAKDVVNTTRRLADMAAAVGIPIERLTYALGQVKAYGYLNARDARMFANAGIPLVKNLSEYYTELEGRLVSTADIYDRIKKKQIGYEEVMSTISKMTDEGGKFFDFQAKMAETLKVQLANLTLAWNNMLNDMGEESQGVLVGGIGALKQMFLHWKDIEHILTEVVVTLGAYKVYQLMTTRLMGATSASLDAQILAMKRNNAAMLEKQALTRKLTVDELRQVAAQNQVTAADYRNALSGKNLTKQKALLLVALNKNNVQLKAAIVNMGLLTAQEAANVTTGRALAIVFKSIGISIRNAAMAIKAFMVSNWWMLALGGIYELYHAWDSYNEHVAEVNRSAAEHAKEAFESIKTYLEGDVINTLRETLRQGGKVSSDAEGQKAWDEMREKIELSSSASNVFIARLMQIDDINHRLAAGFDYLNNIQRVAGVMQTLGDDAIKVSTTTLGGLFGEGVKDDLNDFVDAYQKYVNLNENLRQSGVGEEYFNEQKRALEEFRSEVEKTTTSLYNIASREGFNINEQREFFERGISETAQAEQMGIKETRIYRMQAEDEYYAYARKKLVERYDYEGKIGAWTRRDATEREIKALDEEFGSRKAMQESFFTWLTEKQDHAVKNMLRGKTQEEIKQGDWLKGANGKWVEEMARKFSKEYGVSFDGLRKLVMDANTWHINIPVFFQTIGQPLTDVQRDYEARTGKKFSSNYLIKDAKSQVEILDILKKRQKEVANEMDTARKAGDKYWENNKERLKEENDALIADIHAYNALTDAEEKANKKSNRGSKKDPLLDALKQEISLVEKLQGDYDKLTKGSASQAEALETIRGAYGKTIRLLNAQLGKYGLPQLDISQLITGKDPNKALAHFKQTLDTLVSKGMLTLERSKELEAVVEKFTLSAKTYNLDMITKGLNNELGKLKDEYELAVELDADPELGNMFMEMFEINTSNFPKTIDEYMNRAQQEFDKMRKKRNFSAPLNIFKAGDKEWEEWGRQVGLVVDVLDENGNVIDKNTDALDKLTPKFKEAQGVAKKWAQDTVKTTKDLEYELGDLAKKVEIEEAKLAVLEDEAANETNAKQKHLLELQIQKQKEAIEKLKMESVKLLPFYEDLFGDMYNVSVGRLKEIAKAAKEVMTPRKGEDGVGYVQRTDSKGNVVFDIFSKDKQGNIKKTTISLEEYIKINKQIDSVQQKIAESSPWEKIKDSFSKKNGGGLKNFASGMETIGGELQKIANITKEIGGFAEALGADDETVEIINDVATSIDGVATAAQGIGQIAKGDYIGGAASVLSGAISAISTWFDNSDKKITAKIESSERTVKRLEIAYQSLEHAVNEAYGTATIGAKKAAIANKELQLAELKRQLALEQSRKGKNKDQDKILDLQGQIISLEYEIKDATDQIVNDLLGISSVGDAMENLMDGFVEALRSGEDAMAVFDESIDEMIANMVKKMYVTKILQPWFEKQWDKIQERIDARGADEAKTKVIYQNLLTEVEGESEEYVQSRFGKTKAELMEFYKNAIAEAEKKLQIATTPTFDDIKDFGEILRSGRPILKESIEQITGELNELDIMKDGANKNLSNLQAGISQISETTANALEAYMNGVSQQVYYHSSLLEQIRDSVVGLDLDVSLGVQSQMLLQLQNSYQTQQAIQKILEGVLVPSGRAFAVELMS